MDELGKVWTFAIFSIISLLSFVFFSIFLRETKGLSRDEAQKLYSKVDMLEAEKYRRDSMVSGGRDSINSIAAKRIKARSSIQVDDKDVDQPLVGDTGKD